MKENPSLTHLEYTRSMLAGLLNFCFRSGLADDGACPDCELCHPNMTRFHCRCCYVSVLKTAIQAVDEKIEREGAMPPLKKNEKQRPDVVLLRKEIEDGFKSHGITVDLRALVEYYHKISPEYAAELEKLIDFPH